MSYDSVAEAIRTALVVLGGIIVITNGFNVVRGWFKPQNDTNKSVNERLNKHDSILDKDKQRLDQIDEGNKIIYTCLSTMIEHEISGNNIEKLKELRLKLNTFLINR